MQKILYFLLVSLVTNVHAYQTNVLIHLDSRGIKTQKLALDMANNLQKSYGKNNINIEIVVCGPGLDLVRTDKEIFVERIEKMLNEGIVFSAGWGTMNKKYKKEGEFPELIDGVNFAASGAFRATELQEQGYYYLKP